MKNEKKFNTTRTPVLNCVSTATCTWLTLAQQQELEISEMMINRRQVQSSSMMTGVRCLWILNIMRALLCFFHYYIPRHRRLLRRIQAFFGDSRSLSDV